MAEVRNQSLLTLSTFTFYIDDTTMLICSWVLFSVICQIINIFGIITNCINIACFVKQGFKDSINISLLGLSCSDLASLVTMAMSCLIMCPALDESDLSFGRYDVTYLVSATPHFAFTRVSSCITAMITLERCLSISQPLKVKSIVTPQRTTVTIICIFIIFTLSTAPIYIVNTLGTKYSPVRNRTIIGIIYGENRDQVEAATLSINNFFIPIFTFVVIAMCTLILVLQLHRHTNWRKINMTQAQAETVSARNQKVAKMVVFISSLFIVCLFPNAIIMFAVALEPELFINGKYVKLTEILTGFTYNMESINCSMNIFIYYNMSSKYWDTFRKLFIR